MGWFHSLEPLLNLLSCLSVKSPSLHWTTEDFTLQCVCPSHLPPLPPSFSQYIEFITVSFSIFISIFAFFLPSFSLNEPQLCSFFVPFSGPFKRFALISPPLSSTEYVLFSCPIPLSLFILSYIYPPSPASHLPNS